MKFFMKHRRNMDVCLEIIRGPGSISETQPAAWFLVKWINMGQGESAMPFYIFEDSLDIRLNKQDPKPGEWYYFISREETLKNIDLRNAAWQDICITNNNEEGI